MKAARIHQHGGPEVLVYEDAPEPRLRPDQVPDRFGKVIVRP
jgi:NADPH:quinone reductase-like Zn-dependent oxidoreductase